MLAYDVNLGFQDLNNIQVLKVNGVKVHNLQHLARLVEDCDTEYVRFDLEWKKVGRAAHHGNPSLLGVYEFTWPLALALAGGEREPRRAVASGLPVALPTLTMRLTGHFCSNRAIEARHASGFLPTPRVV